MVYTISFGEQGKGVYTIGPERRVYTIEASDPEKEKRRVSMGWCIVFFSAKKCPGENITYPEMIHLNVRLGP